MRAFLLLLAMLVSQAALAQAWPNRPVRLLVPFAAGAGINDLTAAPPDLYIPYVHMAHATKDVKVTVLRQKLPEYLARVRRGERLRVTSRGRVIAELIPPSAAEDEAEAARKRLRGSVRRYVRPLDPVIDPDEWDANR